jgi:hypothetical protein
LPPAELAAGILDKEKQITEIVERIHAQLQRGVG